MKKVWFLPFMFAGIISCKKSSVDTSGIMQISYGTSFGECVGYCKNEMTLSSEKLSLKSSGWSNTVMPTSCELEQSKIVLDTLGKKIKADAFFRLKEVWGCPDRADGGAEWVELKMYSGKTHRVTFEYRNEPSELKSILPDLRFKLHKTPCMTIYEGVK